MPTEGRSRDLPKAVTLFFSPEFEAGIWVGTSPGQWTCETYIMERIETPFSWAPLTQALLHQWCLYRPLNFPFQWNVSLSGNDRQHSPRSTWIITTFYPKILDWDNHLPSILIFSTFNNVSPHLQSWDLWQTFWVPISLWAERPSPYLCGLYLEVLNTTWESP